MQNLPETMSLCCVYLVGDSEAVGTECEQSCAESGSESVIICDGVTPWLGHSRLCCLHHCEAHAESLSSQGHREGQSLVLSSGL